MTIRAFYDLPAPAKLNLFLHVVGRQGNGYHLLESVFTLIDWCDHLHIERRDDGQLHRHDLSTALPPDDLCLRAAHLLQKSTGCRLGADISIDKQVPSGAGMGGGSSDAATVLLALNRLWTLHLSKAELTRLGAQLGADVPFFIYGQTALVQGIGEQLSPLPLPERLFAVIKPTASLPTAEIFSSPELRRDTKSAIVTGSLDSNALSALSSGRGMWGHNDLQAVAQSRCDEVSQVLDWMQQAFGNSRMTGSGSAVFSSLGESLQPEATMAAQVLSQCPANWVGRICCSWPQHPLERWAS